MLTQELAVENSQSSPTDIVEAVLAVLAVQEQLDSEATKRVPDWLQGNSFFGEFDLWLFQTIEPADDRICFACNVLDKIVFTGLELRMAFPWLEIVDANLMWAKVHPNCRCKLMRITNPLDYITVSW